jgi:hypothetical protein
MEPKTGNVKGITLREVDKREDEANRYTKLYNLQRTLDEKSTADYRFLFIEVI